MAVTNFDTINGQIVSEYTGTTQLDYLTDALGSVTGVCDQTGAVAGSARFKPYGATLSSNGTQASVGWVGTKGYRPTGLTHSEFYVRARQDSDIDGRWTTVDPLWPGQPPYGYARQGPTTLADPTGREGWLDLVCPIVGIGIDIWQATHRKRRRSSPAEALCQLDCPLICAPFSEYPAAELACEQLCDRECEDGGGFSNFNFAWCKDRAHGDSGACDKCCIKLCNAKYPNNPGANQWCYNSCYEKCST